MESAQALPPLPPPAVSLRPITAENRSQLEALQVAPAQQNFVDGVQQSLAEAAAHPELQPWCRAVYAEELPVGFVMLADDVPPGNEMIPWRYYLWRMLIDERYQRRGHGRAALAQVVAHLGTRPGAEALVTSIVAGDGSPLDFYLANGFQPTGEIFDHEQVLRLALPPS